MAYIGPAFYDALDEMLGMDHRVPGMHEAYIEARNREARLIRRPCKYGHCVELIDPVTGENTGGFGPVGCACQYSGEGDQR